MVIGLRDLLYKNGIVESVSCDSTIKATKTAGPTPCAHIALAVIHSWPLAEEPDDLRPWR